MALVIILLAVFLFGLGLSIGTGLGLHVGTERTDRALKLARYNDAIALADDLVKTPDALDLRPRAQGILAAHHAANNRE